MYVHTSSVCTRFLVLTSDPVPELEHVLLIYAELLHLGAVGAEKDKVLNEKKELYKAQRSVR